MKVQFYDRVWRVFLILIFVFGTTWIPGSAQAAGSETIQANWNTNFIEGFEWPLGETVTVEVDGPQPGSPDYSGTAVVGVADWNPEVTWFSLQVEGYDLAVGDVVTVTYGATIKQLTLTGVEITNVDSDANTVTGIAAASSVVDVWICGNSGCSDSRMLSADGSGDWSTDFDDEPAFDIRTNANVTVAQTDGDGDVTVFQWQVPNPSFDAWFQDGNINAYGWPLSTELTLTVGDPADPDFSTTTEVITAPWDSNQTLGEFQLGDSFDILPGMTITVAGATLTKQLVVSNLTITDIDTENDIITGGAGIDQMMWMYYNSTTDTCCRDFQANGSGVWTVDYGELGPNDEPTEDIGPGSSGTINARDDDDDNTSLSWHISNPRIEARTIDERVEGYEWPLGATVTLEIDDPATLLDPDYTDTDTVVTADWNPNETYIGFALSGVYDLKSGDVISLTDGTTIKLHTVTSLTMTGVDPATDVVTGTAAASSHINIWICNSSGCYNREEDANLAGNWSTDFGDSSQTTFDIVAGTWVDSAQWDEDGDGTLFNRGVPNPRIEARPTDERVEGYEWPLDATVALEIDDPATLLDPDYTDTGTVEAADWDPNQTYIGFALSGVYDLKSGDVISLTDGTTIKLHTVTSLTMTNIDPETDVVTGTAATGSHVNVWICNNTGCYNREEDANLAGNWSTDFGDSSQTTFDIVAGTWVDSAQWDEDGDGTLSGLNVANPHIVANAQDNWIHAREWDEGTSVTLTINGDTSNSISAVVTDPQPWDPSMYYADFDLAGYDLEVGDVIVVEGNGITKQLTVSPLKVTDVNLATDMVLGVTTPGADVGGGACAPESNCVDRSTTADGISGAWSLDYHTGIDLVPGSNGWVQEWDEDGDGTEDGWEVPIIDINVKVGAIDQTYAVPVKTSRRVSYAVDSGPVKIASTDGTPIIASERINLLNHPAVSSYTEFMGLPATQVTDKYIFPWYNNVSLDSQLRIANVGSAPTTVIISIGDVLHVSVPLGINESKRLKYNLDTGPVIIESSDNVPIIASERINLPNHPAVSSYTEFMGLLGSDTAGTRYLFPWYNNASLDSQLRIANVGSGITTVHVKIGDQINDSFTLGGNQSRRLTYPNVDAGPVEVTSSGSVPIIVSERVNLLNHPAVSSYSELIGLPGTTVTHTKYIFPWYNNVSLDSQLRIANVGNDSTTVTVKIGTVVDDSFTLGANQSVRKTYNADTGPVTIESSGGIPIIASERVNLLNHPAVSSYSEFIGLSVGDPLGWPGNQLSDTYWFPWYNNASLDSQLRFGVPYDY